MGAEVFIDPTRDLGVDVCDMNVENYKVLYGSRLTEKLKTSKPRLFCARSDYSSSKEVLNSLVGICNRLLGGGNFTGIIHQGILKRLIMCRDIGVKARVKGSKVVDLKICYGKMAKNYTKDAKMMKYVQEIISVISLCGIPGECYTFYIELGFLYVSSIDLSGSTRSRDFAITGNTLVDNEKGPIVRLAYVNTPQGLYDVNSKYRNILGEAIRGKVRYINDWRTFDEKYEADLIKIITYLQQWVSDVVSRNKVYGNVFLLRQKGSAIEVLDSVPPALDNLENSFYEYECKSFKWSSLSGGIDETHRLVSNILGETYSSSFPDLHSIRWDISIVGSNTCYCYFARSVESGAVDILITGYDYLN